MLCCATRSIVGSAAQVILECMGTETQSPFNVLRLFNPLSPVNTGESVFTLTIPFALETRRWTATFFAPTSYLSSRRTFAPWTLLIVLTILVVVVLAGESSILGLMALKPPPPCPPL